MPLTTGTKLSRTVLTGLMLSFVGAKGCFGGDVSLGNDGPENAGSASDSSQQTMSYAGKAPVSTHGGGANAAGGSAGKAGSTGGSGGEITVNAGGSGGASQARLTVNASGEVSSASAFAVSGVLYSASDGAGVDGSRDRGDCESSGHTSSDCSVVSSPSFIAAGALDWSASGLLCTTGTVARVLDMIGTPGSPDYAGMWGSAIGFDFADSKAGAQPYDASAHGVIGFAFDIDAVPLPGLRVELLDDASPNEPAAWQPAASGASSNLVSPVRAGHNVVLFQDAKPLPFYVNQAAFDPTQILSVQFHVPTNANASALYSYCVSNLSLILGTPATPTDGGCASPLDVGSGFEYWSGANCVSAVSSQLSCSPASDPALTVPSQPAVSKLPCVRRLSDSVLFLALTPGTPPQDWATSPASAWSQLPSDTYADCTAEEAALLAAAPVCPVPLP